MWVTRRPNSSDQLPAQSALFIPSSSVWALGLGAGASDSSLRRYKNYPPGTLPANNPRPENRVVPIGCSFTIVLRRPHYCPSRYVLKGAKARAQGYGNFPRSELVRVRQGNVGFRMVSRPGLERQRRSIRSRPQKFAIHTLGQTATFAACQRNV